MRFDVHVFHHIGPDQDEVLDLLDTMNLKLNLIIQKEDLIMSAQTDALDQAEAAAAANASADDAAEQLLVTLSGMIADLKANATDPATVTRINALATALNSRAAQLGTAVAANTPAAPPA